MNVFLLGRWIMDASIIEEDAGSGLLVAMRSLIVAIATMKPWAPWGTSLSATSLSDTMLNKLFAPYVTQNSQWLMSAWIVELTWENISAKSVNSMMTMLASFIFIAMIAGSAELEVQRISSIAKSVAHAIRSVFVKITYVLRTLCGITVPFAMSIFSILWRTLLSWNVGTQCTAGVSTRW